MGESFSNQQIKLPSRGWLFWLTSSRLAWQWLMLVLGLSLIWSSVGQWLDNSVATDPRLGILILMWIIWLYWNDRLKGVKPHLYPNLDFGNYFSFYGRQIFWGAVRRFYASHAATMTSQHLLDAVLTHQGTRLTLIRLQLTTDDIHQATVVESLPLTDILAKATEFAVAEHSHVSWDDLLKSLLTVSPGLKQLLADYKITTDEAIAVVNWSRGDVYHHPTSAGRTLFRDLFGPRRNLNKTWTARPTPVLDRFSQNLTDLARVGLLTSAKIRTQEVDEAIRVLSRSSGNNLILVGEAGVGKTSIVGDIALKMIQGQITALDDYKLIALDIGAMIAFGTFDKVFSSALNEASSSGNTILFIGNLDQFGKASTSEGFDVSAILLSALDKPGLQIIGTSDPLNYKKYIENNSNLVQKFTRVNIPELDTSRAILVLEDLSDQIENRQRVLITLAAVKAAVILSQRLIHQGQLPDKAVDLLDEAAVYTARQGRQLVGANDVEAVISTKTNVPVGEIDTSEREKLVNLSDQIHTRMIGQDEAVNAVSEALKRARLNVSANTKRPIGTFLFLGPTGVGKTELAKSLAWAYFGDDTKMIRLDMSEYQTADSINRLLGAPATSGDIALSGGKFTESVKAMPFAVVLLDEIEKAHPDILNVFLQVLDEGRLTDNLGNMVDFTHTIIIATSNAQARFIEEAIRSNQPYTDIQEQMRGLLVQESFKPEFINRFDGVIIFKPLTPEQIFAIAQLKLKKLQQFLSANKGLELIVDDVALHKLADRGYDPAFGARPLERLIRDQIETKVANALLANPSLKELTITPADIL
ncbi:MAG: ATP-dependent Clp protease ATP-binding subunit [Patescibacteria group bacterium]|jgi:ATP-dependent Clp protease ATP-binding subunit ClpC